MIFIILQKIRHQRWRLTYRIAPWILIIALAKALVHYLYWEFLSVSSLFTALISANVFLIGFLISGVLVDFKESEKIPGDMAATIESIADEAFILYQSKKAKPAKELLVHLKNLAQQIDAWFYKKVRSKDIQLSIDKLNSFYLDFEPLTQPNFIVRLKQEQNLLRKIFNRAHTIRDTSFLGSGYAVAEIITFLLVVGLVFIKIEPFYESIFFTSFVSFVLIYMVSFIKDLDNPFGYTQENHDIEAVSLKPLTDTTIKLDHWINNLP